jgi:hypothetical protein
MGEGAAALGASELFPVSDNFSRLLGPGIRARLCPLGAQDVAYDASKDPIMKRVLQMLGET